jgi:hypothetical protein
MWVLQEACLALLIAAPLLEVGVLKNPMVRVFKKAAISFLNTLLVITGIGKA